MNKIHLYFNSKYDSKFYYSLENESVSLKKNL